MSINELEAKVEALKEWENLADEAAKEIEVLKDALKAELAARETEELQAGKYIIRWTSVLTQRFDSTAFKKALPDVYKAYIKQTASRRFTVA